MRAQLVLLVASVFVLIASPAIANTPPVANAGADILMYLGEATLLDGSAWDPDGDPIVGWVWTIESRPPGSTAELWDPNRPNPHFIPDVLGEYIFSLVVTDGMDESLPDTCIVAVETNLPPVAVATATPESGSVPLLVQFDASQSYDPEGRPFAYLEWSFGDLTVLSHEVSPLHEYIRPGTFTARLEVTDDVGQRDMVFLTIHIVEGGTFTLDIKPGSCPNPFNLKNDPDRGGNGKGEKEDHAIDKKTGGVLPAAIVGSEDADVTEIDVSTILLEGVAPVRSSYEDVTSPVENDGDCACTTEGPDGYLDLTLKFSRSKISEVLGEPEHGEVIELTITGALMDGTPFEAGDCITIVGKRPEGPKIEAIDVVQMSSAVPNPFNPMTRIQYYVPDECMVSLVIFDSSGRLVRRLVDNVRESKGMHAVEWRGVDMHGRAVGSGVYFYRLRTGDKTISKKLILLR